MFKAHFTGNIQRESNGSLIPADPENIDYQEYLAWVAKGNTLKPVDPESDLEVNRKIDAQIAQIELTKTLRALREAVLTGDKTRLQAMEDEIATLRSKRKK